MAGRGRLHLALVALVVLGCLAGTAVGKARSKQGDGLGEFRQYGLDEAEDEVDELRRMVAEQEAVVAEIKRSLSKGLEGECSSHDGQCLWHGHEHDQDEIEAGGGPGDGRRGGGKSKKNRKRRAEGPKFRVAAKLKMPKGAKPVAIKWLPYPNTNAPREMNRMMVAADAKGALHFFDCHGSLLHSHNTGRSVTSMAVSSKWDGELKVLTGGPNGEVHLFTVSPPPRHDLPRDVLDQHVARLDAQRAASAHKGGSRLVPNADDPWRPMVTLVSSFVPAKMWMLDYDNRTKLTADMSGPTKGLSYVEYVPRGKSAFNILAADSSGRVSMHIRNGTITASFALPDTAATGGSPCAAVMANVVAFCDREGLQFYSVKDRFVHRTRCFGFPPSPPGRGEAPPAPPGGGGGAGGGGKDRRHVRRATEPLTSRIVSLAPDATVNHLLYAGTEDGRMLSLQVKGDGTALRCTVMHDQAVTLTASRIALATMKGHVVAAASPPAGGGGGASLSIYNTSSGPVGRHPPDLLMHVPLGGGRPRGGGGVVATDRHAGVAVLTPDGEGAVLANTAAFHAPPGEDTLVQVLGWVRSPLVLILAGGAVMWQVRKRLDQRDASKAARPPVDPADRWEHGRGMTDAFADRAGRLGLLPEQQTDAGMYGQGAPRYGGTDAERFKRYGVSPQQAGRASRSEAEAYSRVDEELHSGGDFGHHGARRNRPPPGGDW